jgi:hypothetical protein
MECFFEIIVIDPFPKYISIFIASAKDKLVETSSETWLIIREILFKCAVKVEAGIFPIFLVP